MSFLRVVSVVCAVVVTLAGAPPAGAAPPAGQTYFTILFGFNEAYDWEADCLKFTGSTVCTSDSTCGTWTPTGTDTFDLELSWHEDGALVTVEAEGRSETAGKKDSIGGAGTVRAAGRTFNYGFTGRPLSARKCKKLLRAWLIANPPPQVDQFAPCLERAQFAPAVTSEYILPFPPPRTYHLSQTYCYLDSTHRNELAYDFDLPLGGEIVAARGGEVIAVSDDRPNDSPWPDANYMKIRHQDGTVAHYIHLMQDSARFSVGTIVEQGQVIAQASMSGTILSHLHFVVFRADPPVEGQDVPVSFRNCEGPIDTRGGLIQEQDYRALRF